MPLAIVSQVAFGADSANSRGAARRRSAVLPPRQAVLQPSIDFPIEEAPVENIDNAGDEPVSTAGLSILAQALAAYGQN